jgi:hypothetical protein
VVSVSVLFGGLVWSVAVECGGFDEGLEDTDLDEDGEELEGWTVEDGVLEELDPDFQVYCEPGAQGWCSLVAATLPIRAKKKRGIEACISFT